MVNNISFPTLIFAILGCLRFSFFWFTSIWCRFGVDLASIFFGNRHQVDAKSTKSENRKHPIYCSSCIIRSCRALYTVQTDGRTDRQTDGTRSSKEVLKFGRVHLTVEAVTSRSKSAINF